MVCTIIGMGPGVSYSIARKFAKEGFKIAMVARKEKKLEEFKNQLTDEGFEAFGFVADASDFNSLKDTFSSIHAQLGATDVLIYNAAVMRQGNPSSLNPDTLVNDFKCNVAGALVSAQQVIPLMKNKMKGTILFTGGGLAISPYSIYSSLAVGKAGIRNLALSLYQELKPLGIHAGTITISGFVKKGTSCDPDLVSQKFWEMHLQDSSQFESEIIVK